MIASMLKTPQTLERAWVDFLRSSRQETSLQMEPLSNRFSSTNTNKQTQYKDKHELQIHNHHHHHHHHHRHHHHHQPVEADQTEVHDWWGWKEAIQGAATRTSDKFFKFRFRLSLQWLDTHQGKFIFYTSDSFRWIQTYSDFQLQSQYLWMSHQGEPNIQ